MEAYLATTLSALLDISLKEQDIEIAHRIGSPVEDKTRTVIFKLFHLRKRDAILKAARTKTLVLSDISNVTLRISEDISVRRRKLRDQYWPLREQLHKRNIKTRVRNPGTLLVWIDEQPLKFQSLEMAVDNLKPNFPDLKIK